jgi:hypothetical protein
MADTALRIDPKHARQQIRNGSGALLVCAYDSAEKCREFHLDGAMNFDEFRARTGSLPRDREIIFYCA